MNKTETAKLLAVLRAMPFANKPDGDPELTLRGYMLGLDDVSYSDAEAAAALCLKESDFFPTVAALRKYIPGAVRTTQNQSGIDARNVPLYRRFAQLHGQPRTPEEDQEYSAICRRLGVAWVVGENPVSRKLQEVGA